MEMKKEMYDEIITLAHEKQLEGVLCVAAYDFDITPEDFLKLSERVNVIKEKCEEIGK